jgi:hypothetical protein
MTIQEQYNKEILERFLAVLDELKKRKQLRSRSAFFRASGIEGSTIWKLQHGLSSYLQAYWLSLLVERFDVRADYLLIGRGHMFRDPRKSRGVNYPERRRRTPEYTAKDESA